jgi:hypothetical protein
MICPNVVITSAKAPRVLWHSVHIIASLLADAVLWRNLIIYQSDLLRSAPILSELLGLAQFANSQQHHEAALIAALAPVNAPYTPPSPAAAKGDGRLRR